MRQALPHPSGSETFVPRATITTDPLVKFVPWCFGTVLYRWLGYFVYVNGTAYILTVRGVLIKLSGAQWASHALATWQFHAF